MSPLRGRLHLAARDQDVATEAAAGRASSDGLRAYVVSACGQGRGFYSEATEVESVASARAAEVTCGKCRRIARARAREVTKVADYWRVMVAGAIVSTHRTKGEAERAARKAVR